MNSQKNKKILIASLSGPSHSARRGGAQEYIFQIARHWVMEGHHVDIFCAQERMPNSDQSLPEYEELEGVRVSRFGEGRGRRNLLALRRKVARVLKEYDHVVDNLMTLPPLSAGLFGMGKPVTAIKHHFLTAELSKSLPIHKRMVLWLSENFVLPVAYRRCSLVANSRLTSDGLADRWRRFGLTAKPTIVAPGHESKLTDAKRSLEPNVLFVGYLNTSRKRVDQLIQAFRGVQNEIPNAELTIAGDGPSLSDLKEQAQGLNVNFLGFVSDDEKDRLLDQAWVFASPSYAEGFGISWIEANAHGVPVVGYDLGLDTLNDNCSIMVKKGDVKSLKEGICCLLTDAERREMMGKYAIENASRFSWKAASDALLRELLANGKVLDEGGQKSPR